MALQTVKYPNGVTLQWDDSIQVGSLVTAYHSGYHVVTGLEYRGDNETPVFHYARVIKDDGTRVKKPKSDLSCCASYCRHVTRAAVEEIYLAETNAAAIRRNNLLDFLPAEG